MFYKYGEKGVDIIEFIKIFLMVIEHRNHEIIYLVLSLIDLFKEISENFNNIQNI